MWQCNLAGLLVCRFLNQLFVQVQSWELSSWQMISMSSSALFYFTNSTWPWQKGLLQTKTNIYSQDLSNLHIDQEYRVNTPASAKLLRLQRLYRRLSIIFCYNSYRGKTPGSIQLQLTYCSVKGTRMCLVTECSKVYIFISLHSHISKTWCFLYGIVFRNFPSCHSVHTPLHTAAFWFQSLFLYLALVVNSASVPWWMRLSVI